MTPTPPGDWDDGRLDAAFAARAASTPSTPSDLADAVLRGAIRAERRASRFPRLAFTGAVATVVAVLAGSMLILENKPAPGASSVPVPSTPISAPPPATSRPETDILDALGGPITVTEALAIRASEVNEQEIAVKGFLSPLPTIYCALDFGPLNPTYLRCAEPMRWVMEQQEQLWGPSASGTHRPTGPAFNPSFSLVDPPDVPMPTRDDELPPPVVLVGHFHDRRAGRCDASDRDACENTFVVDRIVEVNGIEFPVRTDRSTETVPHDPEREVDSLVAAVAPTAVVVSRQLMPVAQVFFVEPILSIDQLIPYVDQSRLAWLVTTIDLVDVPIARTFMLLDGSDWFVEIGRSVTPLERPGPKPSQGTVPLGPTAEPDAFASAPFSVLGIRVRAVADVNRERKESRSGYRDEYALRGWYIAPRPGATCDPPILAVGAPGPPCDDARHWLMGDPHEYGISAGQPRANPVAPPAVLNPLVPVDVPIDVGETWRGEVPVPQPVIVLGHFADQRVSAVRGGGEYFVIDALAWSRTDVPIDRVNRMTTLATEDPASVSARFAAVSPERALATWITSMEAADFVRIEANAAAEDVRELRDGGPVWVVRRLILEEDELAPRFTVESGYTADHGTRVWWAKNLDSDALLATTLDLHDLDEHTTLLRVYDNDDQIRSVRSATGIGALSWQPVDGTPQYMEVAPGGSPREVVIRWMGVACDTEWRLEADVYDGSVSLEMYPTGSEDCGSERVRRRMVIEFKDSVDIDRINSGYCCG